MKLFSIVLTAVVLATPSGAWAQGAAAPNVPEPPSVTDPMLGPVPPPKRVLQSWEEAVGYLRGRSTNLRIAVDQVLQAEAQTGAALAQYLPSLAGCSGGSAVNGCANGSYTHQLITRPPSRRQKLQQRAGSILAAACGERVPQPSRNAPEIPRTARYPWQAPRGRKSPRRDRG